MKKLWYFHMVRVPACVILYSLEKSFVRCGNARF